MGIKDSPFRIVAGIDLHGTLITDGEYPEPGSVRLVSSAVGAFSGAGGNPVVCTGNDLPFLFRKTGRIAYLFHSAVLETGAVVSTDMKTERVLVPPDVAEGVKNLESYIKGLGISGVYKIPRRLATISLFAEYGVEPAELAERVTDAIRKHPFFGSVRITYSSVAVDIIPRGFSKWTGISRLAGDLPTVAIADSMNDLEFLKFVDYSFTPSNVTPGLLTSLEKEGKEIRPLDSSVTLPEQGVVYVSGKRTTFAVSEILVLLAAALRSGWVPSGRTDDVGAG